MYAGDIRMSWISSRGIGFKAFIWVVVVTLGYALAFAQETARTDGQIEMDVVRALDASQALKNDLITAATIQAEVTLSGTVASDSSRRLAESIVKSVPGVTAVHNNLKVGDPAAAANAQATPLDDGNDEEMAGSQPQAAPPQMGQPDYGQNSQQNAPPSVNQNPPPGWGQNQRPGYGQNPQPGYGQAPPPPGYGQAPPPGYGYGQYPPAYGQNQYPPPPYSQPQYAQQQPPPPRYQMPRGPVTVPAGTLIQLRTSEAVNSKKAQPGEPIQLTLIQDVTYAGVLAIPRGATLHGVIADVRHPEHGLTGSAELALQLTSLDLAGRTYQIESDQFKVKGPGKGERSAANTIGGAALGAMIGGIAGGGAGAAIGAAAGGGAGIAASAASSGPGVWIPAEALVNFHLAAPITVEPVSAEEAMRLAQALYPGGPALYRRPPYGYPYRPYPYYYAPARVYYRPY
jgi:BON domain